jgi:hypothetical protein
VLGRAADPETHAQYVLLAWSQCGERPCYDISKGARLRGRKGIHAIPRLKKIAKGRVSILAHLGQSPTPVHKLADLGIQLVDLAPTPDRGIAATAESGGSRKGRRYKSKERFRHDRLYSSWSYWCAL